jgi:hypothetical protein
MLRYCSGRSSRFEGGKGARGSGARRAFAHATEGRRGRAGKRAMDRETQGEGWERRERRVGRAGSEMESEKACVALLAQLRENL